MRPMDISALFGNALDNAIESVRKIADPDKRLIHVSVQRQKGFLRIRIENCFEGKIRFENGMPVTSKRTAPSTATAPRASAALQNPTAGP